MSLAPVNAPFQVFCSYAREDFPLQEKLVTYLTALKRIGAIELWYDQQIQAGDRWGDEISENLEAADMVLLLVTAAFIKSDYCYTIEMKRALELNEEKQVEVIPIIASPCPWRITEISDLQVLPSGAVPVTKWADEAEAWTDVSLGIHEKVKRLKQETRSETAVMRDLGPLMSSNGNSKVRGFGYSGPSELEMVKTLLMAFFQKWPKWWFNLARVKNWGGRQPGFQDLAKLDKKLLEKALDELAKEQAVGTRISEKTGHMLCRGQ